MRDDWLDPQLSARLIELHALKDDAHLTMRQIADRLNQEFGTNLTRNSCIGRAHRLKLDLRPSPLPPKPKPKVRIDAPIPAKIANCKPAADGVTFFQNRGCWWAYGGITDRPERFCGRPKRQGSSWCSTHYQQVYNEKRPGIAKASLT